MKVVWLCNTPTAEIRKAMNIPSYYGGGWLNSLSRSLSLNPEIELHLFFFTNKIMNVFKGETEGLYYHAFPEQRSIKLIQKLLFDELRIIKPDIIHIFGTEMLTSYAMALACQELQMIDRTLVHIQGLVSISSKHYDSGIPWLWSHLMMPRDFLRNTSITRGKRDFARRGKYEIETIKLLKHISGRTDWDRACTFHINPQAEYHFCNETLRESFYQHRWDIDKCERHRIFVSQGNYPIKGLHFMLEALPLILKHYPDTRLFVGGSNPTAQGRSLKTRLKRTSYGQYLLYLIKKHKLSDHVIFTGPLDEQQMIDCLLKSHVFVSPSTIENSPNSLGEAMILGMPCVSSYVGGVPSMLKDKEEGYLYQTDAPYMLAHYVMEIFSDDNTAIKLGESAKNHAIRTHNSKVNLERLLNIYNAMIL